MSQKTSHRPCPRSVVLSSVSLAALVVLLVSQAPAPAASPSLPVQGGLAMKTLPIQSEGRKALAREYARIHYGLDEWRLVAPRLVIVHYTGSDSDAVSLSVFKPARLEASRTDIEAGGSLNVGVHYMIAKDGTIWSLLPESDMGRHAIGYNHVALGIELTGSSADKLTPAQLEACAALVADIARRTPSITYLCGHHEYVQEGRAHTVLYRELQPGYGPTRKTDPGEAFMNALRRLLLDRYSLNFLD